MSSQPSAASRRTIETGERVFVGNYAPREVVLDHVEGARVWDVDGNEYIDLGTGISVNNLGHQHPAIVEAIKQQADRLCYISPAMGNDVRSELAELIAEITPGDLTSTLFTTGGG